jgi:hypothetical protein
LSIIQGPFSVAPRKTLISRPATFPSLYGRALAAGAATGTPAARTRGAKPTDEGKLRKVSGRLFPDRLQRCKSGES